MSDSEEEITRAKKPLSQARLDAIEKMKEGRRKQLAEQKKDKEEIINNYYDDDDDDSSSEEEEINNYYSQKQMGRRPNKKNHKEPEPQQEVEYEDIHSPYEPNNPMDNISFC